MGQWDTAAMATQIAIRPHTHAHASWAPWRRYSPWLLAAVLAAGALHLAWSAWPQGEGDASDAPPPIAQLVHWRDASHDWLIVADKATSELVVYDANDGRPLRRLGVANGLGPVDEVIGEGNRLVVVQQDAHVQVFGLPDLRPLPLGP
jgi:hypothetical protein